MHPTSDQAPRLFARCQTSAGTIACGCSPTSKFDPNRIVVIVLPPRPRFVDADFERNACIEVPNLDALVQTMPRRLFSGSNEKVDGSSSRVCPRLTVVTAFWVRNQVQLGNQFIGIHDSLSRQKVNATHPSFGEARAFTLCGNHGSWNSQEFGKHKSRSCSVV